MLWYFNIWNSDQYQTRSIFENISPPPHSVYMYNPLMYFFLQINAIVRYSASQYRCTELHANSLHCLGRLLR